MQPKQPSTLTQARPHEEAQHSALQPDVTAHLEAELAVLAFAVNYRRWLWDRTRPHLGPRVLEVGAGLGYMTELIAQRELAVAMELVPSYVDHLRNKFPAPNVEVVAADATDAAAFDPYRGRITSAMSFNVLEHIHDDVAVLRNVHHALPPGGSFVVFVPAFPSIYGHMDAKIGHVRRYRRDQLVERASRAGFQVTTADYMNLPGFFAWWLNGRVLRFGSAAGGERTMRLYDAGVIRLARWMETHVRPPFGQSLFAVLRRSA